MLRKLFCLMSVLILGAGSITHASCRNSPAPKSRVGLLELRAVDTQTQEALSGTTEDGHASIVGFWHVLFYNPDGTLYDDGYDVWHSDRTEILNDTITPEPPYSSGAICLGVYKQTGPRTYKLKHPFWAFDGTGTLIGTGVLLEEVTLGDDGNSYSGTFDNKNFDLHGNLTSEQTGTLKAQRITPD